MNKLIISGNEVILKYDVKIIWDIVVKNILQDL
jgi:hypothetical protein